MDGELEYTNNEWAKICNEFSRTKDQHYLDHAGATLYAETQLNECFQNFTNNVYCNPHTSKTTEDLIDQVRFKILQSFNTSSDEYSVVFTSGATASLKIVAETFNFSSHERKQETGSFVYLRDCHTSILGMREIVATNNISPIEKKDLLDILDTKYQSLRCTDSLAGNSLLVFPAQCNFNGYKYPLDLIEPVQLGSTCSDGCPSSKWYVCLDAASFVSTNQLDLSHYKPDFVCLSFYKIFGYPTGLGALIVSKRGQEVLCKKYYGGGTVKITMSAEKWHQKRDCFHERFEDGTLPFLSIISLLSGFNTLDKLIPPKGGHTTMSRISRYTFQMAQYLYRQLKQLKHKNGKPAVKFYHDSEFMSSHDQGGIVNFNVLRNDGQFVGFAEIACMANIYNITLRTGCFCNPGACQRHLKLTTEDIRAHYKAGHICGDANDLIDGIPTGAVRVSIGYMTSKSNVNALIQMITECYILLDNKSIGLDGKIIQKLYKINIKNLKTNEPKTNLSNRPKMELDNEPGTKVRLKEICIYPIKSCGAMKITSQWPLTYKGLKYDREWMIVAANGTALTQKTEQKLCLVRPEICENTGTMKLSFPYMDSIQIPLKDDDKQQRSGALLCQSKVCGDKIQGIDCGDAVANWLSDALCINGLRLLRQSEVDQRTSKNKNNTNGQSISLTNQAQFLLINTKSVLWLMDKVTDWTEQPEISSDDRLDGVIDRFRGNLIVESPIELDEQNWDAITIDGIQFKSDGPCLRCQMICIDQWTGEITAEPLRTIAREFNGKIRFGLYLSHQTFSKNDKNKVVILKCNSDVLIHSRK